MTQASALTDPDYSTPGTGVGLFGALRQRYLLKLLLKKGIATRYYGSVLGWVWSYVRPAAQFFMYYLIVGVILDVSRGISAFPIYLFAGIVAINLFSETLRNATTAITDNAPLVQKIFVPRELFPVSAAGVALVHFLPQAFVLFVVCLILGWGMGWMPVLALLLGMVIIVTFALGLGLLFGAINVLYRDAVNFVDLILMFATWASPVLYSWEMVQSRAPEWLFNLFMLNPITVAVELFHDAFWLPLAPGSLRPEQFYVNIIVALAISLLTLLLGQLVFRRLEARFAQSL